MVQLRRNIRERICVILRYSEESLYENTTRRDSSGSFGVPQDDTVRGIFFLQKRNA